MSARRSEKYREARNVFVHRGGTLRTSEALEAGIHPRTLYAMRDSGLLEQLSRGVYRLAEAELGSPDLVAVAKRVPEGVLCLVSSLAFHELTTQIPHEVQLAVRRNSTPPKIDYPPVRIFRFDESTFENGVETHVIDEVPVRVYSAERTLADCFKYRNKIGKDVAVEALRTYRSSRRTNVTELLRYAKMCRAEKVMVPYLEAIL